MQIKKPKRLSLITVMMISLSVALIYTATNNNLAFAPAPISSSTPSAYSKSDPKPVNIEVKVTPWGNMYREEPDTKADFDVELVYPNQNENFTTNSFTVVVNAGAYFWIVEKARYTSDLFSGERWINISKTQYSVDLQKTFTFNLTNVPEGNHYLTLTVIFHEGTWNNATAFFNVLK